MTQAFRAWLCLILLPCMAATRAGGQSTPSDMRQYAMQCELARQREDINRLLAGQRRTEMAVQELLILSRAIAGRQLEPPTSSVGDIVNFHNSGFEK